MELFGCDCSGCCQSDLSAKCVEDEWPGNLPGLYAFNEGVLGYYIRDGGRDMYDIGNEVRLRINGQWTGPLDYTQVCDGAHPRAVSLRNGGWGAHYSDTTYATCRMPFTRFTDTRAFGRAFVFIAYSATSSIDGLSIMGNLGADEGGKQESNTGSSPLTAPNGVYGYYKKVFGADDPGVSLADPSVNHLIFGKGIGGASVRVGSTTDSDLHELTFSSGTNLIYYVMFAGKEGYEYPLSDFQDILNRLTRSCYDAEYTPFHPAVPEGGGGNAGTVVLIIFLVLVLIAAIGGLGFCYKQGKLDDLMSSMPSMPTRSRTSPTGSSTINLGAPPLQTARAGLAANDSASFATEYTPPSAT